MMAMVFCMICLQVTRRFLQVKNLLRSANRPIVDPRVVCGIYAALNIKEILIGLSTANIYYLRCLRSLRAVEIMF